jgi:long-chain alkane monooxygenase
MVMNDNSGTEGLMLIVSYTPGCFEDFVDLVVPNFNAADVPWYTLRKNLFELNRQD